MSHLPVPLHDPKPEWFPGRLYAYDIVAVRLWSRMSSRDMMSHRRLRVFVTKGTRCAVCGRVGRFVAWGRDPSGHIHADLYTDDFTMMTVDHIIPSSLGGPNELWNLRPLCIQCNGKRGGRLDNAALTLIGERCERALLTRRVPVEV